MDPSSGMRLGTDWQLLGEFELSVNSDANHTIHMRLTDMLRALDLHPDFINRVSKSAQQAVARAMPDGAPAFEHLHILIFASGDHLSEGSSWGFFRIEKIESAAPDKRSRDHAIEFYLYLEQ